MVEQTDSIRRYILEKEYAFRGWKLLPFAVQYRQAPLTEFFTEDSYIRELGEKPYYKKGKKRR